VILKVISPVTRKDGSKYWIRCGSAFKNKDGSINVKLDCVPVGAEVMLQIRPLEEPQRGYDAEPTPAPSLETP
jgi:hypothetical protein